MPTYDLKYPITKGERTVTTLVFPERVAVKHIVAGDGFEFGSMRRELAILSSLTGESDIVLREMDAEDWVKTQAIVNNILTGEKQNENEKKEKRESAGKKK